MKWEQIFNLLPDDAVLKKVLFNTVLLSLYSIPGNPAYERNKKLLSLLEILTVSKDWEHISEFVCECLCLQQEQFAHAEKQKQKQQTAKAHERRSYFQEMRCLAQTMSDLLVQADHEIHHESGEIRIRGSHHRDKKIKDFFAAHAEEITAKMQEGFQNYRSQFGTSGNLCRNAKENPAVIFLKVYQWANDFYCGYYNRSIGGYPVEHRGDSRTEESRERSRQSALKVRAEKRQKESKTTPPAGV